ncbi:hypothetical protein AX208_09555 [Streptococcus agalactiae]|uniref:hypothetical protein n=1 Tax=Streptococcus agalactiae TaxID=1311 RepID=UPI00081040CE|nr:hypothetical protein [Streptococcus agalactiae]OCM02506.1 hypothetical protein AX208_09555 [Streptococcus agalactiae]
MELLYHILFRRKSIEKIEPFAHRQTLKSKAVNSSKTTMSIQRYNHSGTKIQLRIGYSKVLIRIFSNGKINLTHYDLFFDREETLEITDAFDNGVYTQDEVDGFIKQAKTFIKQALKGEV